MIRNPRRESKLLCSLGLAFLFAAAGAGALPVGTRTGEGISREASASCGSKVVRLESYASTQEAKSGQTTRFTENEINSYLAIELSKKYHPSLRSLLITLEESNLRGVAAIDFDALGMHSKSVMARLFARLFSGVHDLSVSGRLVSAGGKGNFVLEEARFDQSILPNFLVEEIITAVGRKQKPPFDPMQPSQLPYQIDRVDVHSGYIDVIQ